MEEQYFEFDFLFGKLSLSERKSRMIVLHTKISHLAKIFCCRPDDQEGSILII